MARITKPNDNNISYNVIYIFPENNITSQNYFFDNMPPEIVRNNVLIYAEDNETYEILREKINSFFIEFSLVKSSESIIGFYKNALEPLSGYNTNFKFFGLINPLLKNNFSLLTINSNVKMVYNTKIWIENQHNIKLLNNFSVKIQQFNGESEEKDLTNLRLINYFFDKYKNILS